MRQLEDLEPIGFKWLTIGLNDVLLDVENNTIYTPNTNALVNMDQAAMNAGDVQAMAKAKSGKAGEIGDESGTEG